MSKRWFRVYRPRVIPVVGEGVRSRLCRLWSNRIVVSLVISSAVAERILWGVVIFRGTMTRIRRSWLVNSGATYLSSRRPRISMTWSFICVPRRRSSWDYEFSVRVSIVGITAASAAVHSFVSVVVILVIDDGIPIRSYIISLSSYN
ncbi:hypothetical protein ABW19_dt0208226 [Dactylella cylindrospora]|nr:hypothetical protein ABW19_dt0208226 [Dactylella cylindrospora]